MSQEDMMGNSLDSNGYKIVFDAKGNLSITNLEGVEVKGIERYTLGEEIKDYFAGQSFIYIAVGYPDGDSKRLHKIGVTKNVDRRSQELRAYIKHYVICSSRRVWNLEKKLHKVFSKYRVRGEWFDFGDDEIIDDFIDQVVTEEQLRSFMRNIEDVKQKTVFKESMSLLSGMFQIFTPKGK